VQKLQHTSSSAGHHQNHKITKLEKYHYDQLIGHSGVAVPTDQ
jgi:hypothetical protein